MKKKHLISVVIPVYNVEKYLSDCLDSIITQTYNNLDIIIVNDGSTDYSLKICEEYLKKDTRICLFSKINSGLSDTRNFGISKAKGDYIIFVDSDDALQNNAIEILYMALKNDEDSVSVCSLKKFRTNYNFETNSKTKIIIPKDYFSDILKLKNFTYACGVLIPKKFLDENFFIKDRYFEDMASMYKIFNKCKKIYRIECGLYKYRINPNSIVHTFNPKKADDYYKSAHEMVQFIVKIYKFDIALINTFMCDAYRSCYILSKDDKYLNKAQELLKDISLNGLSFKNKIKIILLNNIYLTKVTTKTR